MTFLIAVLIRIWQSLKSIGFLKVNATGYSADSWPPKILFFVMHFAFVCIFYWKEDKKVYNAPRCVTSLACYKKINAFAEFVKINGALSNIDKGCKKDKPIPHTNNGPQVPVFCKRKCIYKPQLVTLNWHFSFFWHLSR